MTADDRDPAGRSPLHYAAAHGDLPTVRQCLAGGIEADVADNAGWTPLHFAARAQAAEIVRLLLQHGAPVDPPDSHHNTPLFKAVFSYRGNPDAIRALIDAGADPDYVNRHGVSPRALAERIATTDVATHLRNQDAGAPPPHPRPSQGEGDLTI